MIHLETAAAEKLYETEASQLLQKRIRDGCTWGMLFYPLFAVLDYVVYPDYFSFFLILRIMAELVLAFGLIGTYFKSSPKYLRFIAMVQYSTLCASILVMIHVADGYRSPYYVGLILTLLFLISIYPLSFRSTFVITIASFVGYIVPILIMWNIQEPKILITNSVFLFGVIFFLNISAYVAENMRRQEFAARYGLAEANEELKNLDRLKTRFFANVSHEVRTPLTSIIAPLQSLRQGDVGSLNTDQNELLDQMHRNAVRLLDQINQMLDFSKLEAGKVHLRLASVNLADYTDDIVSMFQEVTVRKGLSLIFEPAEGTEEAIFIDRDRYERIITNLIRNAVKFTETGGLTVALNRVKDHMVLTITDTGIGIPQSQLSHIFKRFEQVDATSTRQHEGTGLGLSIVKESVHLMHGEISVESVVEMGTVFTVKIPLDLADREPDVFIERRTINRRQEPEYWNGGERRATERRKIDYSKVPVSELAMVESHVYESETEEEVDDKNLNTGHRIVIAEDNSDLRNYIRKILSRLGHDVITAENGAEALSLIQNNDDVDMLVTDVMMPQMDGYELLEAIRADDRYVELPVIMVTAKAGEDPKLRALNIGADDYLPKPINVRELDARIRNLMTSRDLRRAAANAAVLNQRIEELRFSFAQALEIRDAETGNHCREVLRIGTGIARKLGVTEDQILKDSLLLHDIGKIGIPDQILLKPSKLSDDEYAVMQTHAEVGKKLLESFSNFQEVSDIIHSHQEHWDGSGYPRGLKGEEIPPIARIIAVADAFHAMTNTRPYRTALSEKEALNELKNHRGTQFDPAVVDAFLLSRNSV